MIDEYLYECGDCGVAVHEGEGGCCECETCGRCEGHCHDCADAAYWERGDYEYDRMREGW